MSHLAFTPHTVYRAYGTDDRLLYVGCTAKGLSRMAQQQSKEWWQKTLYMTFQHFATRDEALLAEAEAIENEDPIHNIRRAGWHPTKAEAIRAQVRERIDGAA